MCPTPKPWRSCCSLRWSITTELFQVSKRKTEAVGTGQQGDIAWDMFCPHRLSKEHCQPMPNRRCLQWIQTNATTQQDRARISSLPVNKLGGLQEPASNVFSSRRREFCVSFIGVLAGDSFKDSFHVLVFLLPSLVSVDVDRSWRLSSNTVQQQCRTVGKEVASIVKAYR